MTNCCSGLSFSSDLLSGNYIRSADGILMPLWFKDPDDVLDFGLGWSNHLAADDVIVAAEFEVSNAALQILSTNFDNSRTFVWLAGGGVGITYFVTCTITTDKGRQHQRTFAVQIGQN